jgi:hypothetical protein
VQRPFALSATFIIRAHNIFSRTHRIGDNMFGEGYGFAILAVISGEKRIAVAQYLISTAAKDGFGDLRLISPPVAQSAEAHALVGIPFPNAAWIERNVNKANASATQRLSPELPFPNGAAELLDCERFILMGHHLHQYVVPVVEPDAFELVPLHDNRTAPQFRLASILESRATTDIVGLRSYFGEPVAFYFAWMKHYNQWLMIPAAFGCLTVTYDWLYDTNADTNPLIPIFSIFIVFWAVLFVAVWERQQNVLACGFHSFGFAEGGAAFAPATLADLKEAVSFREGYHGTSRKNPFTGEREIHFSLKKRFMWQIFSVIVTGAMLAIALGAQVCSLNLQGYMRGQDPLLEIDAVSAYADPGAIFDPDGYFFFVPITVHACSILVLNLLYRRISMWLTTLENYATESEHENAMIVKRVCFEFVDCFAALFYVAFYRRDIVQLRQELVSLYTFDQFRRIALETLVPFMTQRLSAWWSNIAAHETSPLPPSHSDVSMYAYAKKAVERETYESFDDILEMTMQYGYVTLFASAFPLAAFCSVVGNLLEINSDFVKLRYVLRRPMPQREVCIGPWVQVLRLFTYIAVITNVSVFAYTSHQMRIAFPAYFNAKGEMRDGSEEYVVVALFVMEHVLLAAVYLVDWWVPRVPYSVTSLMRQRQKQIVQNAAAAGGCSVPSPSSNGVDKVPCGSRSSSVGGKGASRKPKQT